MFKSIKSKDLVFVGIQLLLFLIYILSPLAIKIDLNTFWRGVGLSLKITGFIILILATLQLNVNLSPFPTPSQDSHLITNGVYRYMRHPIYGGILLAAAGYSLNSADAFRLLVTLALFLLFYFKSNYEEKLLKKRFAGYSDYIKHTGRFLPSLRQLI
ncbi:isoprenylcysteine carboxylmethyltransferase family protein [uncultured Mucilaginibacter sp.]|uniref:methyltransferase family protein n=1 Tax=uncultured Mucilaginibacter sp. TaxID=797541 RepID=UPI0025F92019|nr:isoprenylcysteine carboxylmethyltransferase family protein [uncultured Mucilaginibacter sp.]